MKHDRNLSDPLAIHYRGIAREHLRKRLAWPKGSQDRAVHYATAKAFLRIARKPVTEWSPQ